MTQMEDTSLNWPETRPEIVGPRLFLREPKHADAHAIADMFQDLDIARMTGSIPAIYHPHAANGWISCSLGGFARQRPDRLDDSGKTTRVAWLARSGCSSAGAVVTGKSAIAFIAPLGGAAMRLKRRRS